MHPDEIYHAAYELLEVRRCFGETQDQLRDLAKEISDDHWGEIYYRYRVLDGREQEDLPIGDET